MSPQAQLQTAINLCNATGLTCTACLELVKQSEAVKSK